MSLLPSLGPWAVALAALVVCSAFFSSSESAVFCLPAASSTAVADDEGSVETGPAATLSDLRADPHRLLVTLLVARYFEPGLSVAVATALATTLVLVFGEIVPKSYGLGRAESWSLRVARPIAVLELVLSPLVFVFDRVTRRPTAVVGGDPDIEDPYSD
ncbi:MAG: DUF21 domain-containing protein [Haloarculaceae archaeon]